MTKSTTSDNGKGKKNTSPSKNIHSTDCSIARVPKSVERRMTRTSGSLSANDFLMIVSYERGGWPRGRSMRAAL